MAKLFILLNILPTFLTALELFTYYIVIDGTCSRYPDLYPKVCPLLGHIGHSVKKLEMTALRAGDEIPKGVHFSWVPYTEEKEAITSCGIPQTYNASKDLADRKVVLSADPGAFTPGYLVRHLPGYIEHLKDIKGRGVDIVLVVAMNDAWVMSALRKANGVKNDQIMLMSDPDIAFWKSIGWTRGADRTGRYAMVFDHGKIVYAENEPGGDFTVSGAEAMLSKL